MESWLGWTIFGVITFLIIGFSLGFVLYYKISGEPAGITGTIGFFSLLFTLLSLFLIPIDIYLINSNNESNTISNEIKYTYYIFYSLFMFCLFILIPFGYFYYEEFGDLQNPDNTCIKRSCVALRYTIITGFVWVVLIVIGLFVSFTVKDPSTAPKWTDTVASKFENHASRIMPFCLAVLTCIGMFFSMIYTGWGLASFPISLMKGQTILVGADVGNVQMTINKINADLEELKTKNRGREWDNRDKIKKKNLERKKERLSQDMSKVQNAVQKKNCCTKCGEKFWTLSKPFRFLIALILITFSIILISSIIFHLINQLIESQCGYSCGWAIDNPSKYNPMGYILQQTAKYFPIDYIFFSAVIFWLFWCSIVGIMSIGVRFLFVRLFSLKPGATMHNALLMSIGFLILICCSFNYLLFDLAANYMTYGSQGVTTNCNYDTCQTTQIFNLISGILVGMPVFGLIYFIFSWIFVLVFFISFIYNIYKKPESKLQKLLDDDPDLEPYFKD